jgi:formylglycine-generating enzyme required for sulfatase activity
MLIIISVSGCIENLSDNPMIPKQDLRGWDWEKYEKYSQFYDNINKTKPTSTDTIEDFMVGMSQDTEFDRMWYLTLLYFNRGIEAHGKKMEQVKIYQQEMSRAPSTDATDRSRLNTVAPIQDLIGKYTKQEREYFFKSKEYRQKIEEWNPSKISPKITPTPKMEFVLIPAGEFDIGSKNETERWDVENPVHRVNISKAFYMGKYEVTQKQWRDVMGNNPSSFEGDNLPVETVSWNEVQEFIKKLNEKEGSNKYRLPTEAEWEYAARAGTTTPHFFGNNESKLGDYAWYDSNSYRVTHDVGQKKPNPWGLYDMYGNVLEWVQDKWHDNYSGAPTDQQFPL